jgi:hypothetical protein
MIVRVNLNAYESGEEYLNRLRDEAENNFRIFLSMLSSYWQSSVDGPNYARELKAMAISMSKIRLALDDVRTDTDYRLTRAEFIYQTLSSILFPGEIPNPDLADLDFGTFLRNIVKVYFKGSIPDSIQKAVELVTGGMKVLITENFEEARKPGSGFDISDEHTFNIDVFLSSPGAIDVFLAEKNIRILLSIIRPAHTLYRLKFVLQDEYVGNQTKTEDGLMLEPSKILDAFQMALSNYGYEDFRKFVLGIEGLDYLGVKKPVHVTDEDHGGDW